MPAPISLDIGKRFARLVDGGVSGRSLAHHRLISPAPGVPIAAKHRAGESLARAASKTHDGGKLIPSKAFFEEVLDHDRDMKCWRCVERWHRARPWWVGLWLVASP